VSFDRQFETGLVRKPMETKNFFTSMNTILYCANWDATVAFYRHMLGLPVNLASDWLVEFQVGQTAYLSIADEKRASIKSSKGGGITITLQVPDADETWSYLHQKGVLLGAIKERMEARVFYFHDPEGHRLEIWSPKRGTGR
jgi:predicted enzyme related to lactoylglutathione lyase